MTCHLIITRFSIPTALAGKMRKMDADDAYLQYRYKLFLRFCLPSVRAQTVDNFRWFVLFGESTPEWLREKLDEHERQGDFIPLYSSSFGAVQDSVRTWLRINVKQGEQVITTRLDNDDGIAVGYLEAVQAKLNPELDKQYFDLQYGHQGVIRNCDATKWQFYGWKTARNPFVSMAERLTDAPPLLIYHKPHGSMKTSVVGAPVFTITGGPWWLQVLHGKNIGNGLMSRSVVPPNYAAFPWLEPYIKIGLPPELQ